MGPELSNTPGKNLLREETSAVEYSVGNPAKAEKQLHWKAQTKGADAIHRLVEAEFATNIAAPSLV